MKFCSNDLVNVPAGTLCRTSLQAEKLFRPLQERYTGCADWDAVSAQESWKSIMNE